MSIILISTNTKLSTSITVEQEHVALPAIGPSLTPKSKFRTRLKKNQDTY
jgi:hypothetical protein